MFSLDLGNLLIHLKLDELGLDHSILSVEQTLNKAAGRFSSAALKMSLAVTTPLTLIGRKVTQSAMSLESAFAGVRKTVDATEKQFATLKVGFDEMSKRIPLTVKDIYGIGEAAGQLGVKTPYLLQFTETMAALGATTNMAAKDAAMSAARMMNIMQTPQDQVNRLGSVLVDLGNNMATTEREIMEMGLRMAGAGKIVGMTEAEVLGLAAALSSVGMEAEAGGTAINSIFLDMYNAVKSGTRELKLFATVSGMTANQFKESFQVSAAGAFASFVEGLGRMHAAGQNVQTILEAVGFDNVRMTRTLLSAASAGDLLRDSIKMGSKAWEENIALVEEANKRYKTSESRLTMLKNRVVLAMEGIGNVLAGYLLKFADSYIKPLLTMFQSLLPETQKFIVKLGLIAVAIGPVLVGITMMLKVLASIAGILSVVLSPLGLVAAAVVYLGLSSETASKMFGRSFKGIGDMVKGVSDKIRNWTKADSENLELYANLIMLQVDKIKGYFKSFVTYLQSDYTGATSAVWQMFLAGMELAAKVAIDLAIRTGKGIWEGLKKGIFGELTPEVETEALRRYQASGAKMTTKTKYYGPGGFGGGYTQAPENEALYQKYIQEVILENRNKITEGVYSGMGEAVSQFAAQYQAKMSEIMAKAGTSSAGRLFGTEISQINQMTTAQSQYLQLVHKSKQVWQGVSDWATDRYTQVKKMAEGTLQAFGILKKTEGDVQKTLQTEVEDVGQIASIDEILSSFDRLFNGLDRRSSHYFNYQTLRLEKETALWRKYAEQIAEHYNMEKGQVEELINLYTQYQKRLIEIQELKSSQSFLKGVKAGIMEMQDELKTLGELGAEVARSFRDNMLDSLWDVLGQVTTLKEAMREVALSMARQGFNWAGQQLFQMGMNAVMGLGGAPTAGTATSSPAAINQFSYQLPHTGGIPGVDLLPTRMVSPEIFRNAERAHSGVGPGEKGVIIRNDEGVFTAGQMRAMGLSIRRGSGNSAELAAGIKELIFLTRRQKTVVPIEIDRREDMVKVYKRDNLRRGRLTRGMRE